MAAKPTKANEGRSTSPLVGKWFHSPAKNEAGEIEGGGWQGTILAEPSPGTYLVQLFSWIMGEEGDQVLVPFAEMSDWVFYNSSDEMKFAYEHGAGRVASWERIADKQSAEEKKA